MKSIDKYSFIDFNSIVNVEVFQDLKEKEEIMEKKIQRSLILNTQQDKEEAKTKPNSNAEKKTNLNAANSTNKTKPKASNNKKDTKQVHNTMKLDQMFLKLNK